MIRVNVTELRNHRRTPLLTCDARLRKIKGLKTVW